MSSNVDSKASGGDQLDFPSTSDDARARDDLRRLVPSWLELTPAEIEALLPPDALARRPPIRRDATPFVLD